MNKQALIGFIRGAAYVAIFAVIHYVVTNLGTSGIVSGSTATIVTGILAGFDHVSTLTP